MADHIEKLSLCLAIPPELNPYGIVLKFAGTTDDPLMHAGDLCAMLGNTGVNAVEQMVKRLDEDEWVFHELPVETPETPKIGRPSKYDKAYVNKFGFYKVVITSQAEHAKPLLRKVTHEILPCIAKYGCYPAPIAPTAQPVGALTPEMVTLIGQLIQTTIQAMKPPRIGPLVDVRAWILKTWQDVPRKTLESIIGRMDTIYRHRLGQAPPKSGLDRNSRRMIESEALDCLVDAFNYYFRRAIATNLPDIPFDGDY